MPPVEIGERMIPAEALLEEIKSMARDELDLEVKAARARTPSARAKHLHAQRKVRDDLVRLRTAFREWKADAVRLVDEDVEDVLAMVASHENDRARISKPIDIFYPETLGSGPVKLIAWTADL